MGSGQKFQTVTAGLDPAIHVFLFFVYLQIHAAQMRRDLHLFDQLGWLPPSLTGEGLGCRVVGSFYGPSRPSASAELNNTALHRTPQKVCQPTGARFFWVPLQVLGSAQRRRL